MRKEDIEEIVLEVTLGSNSLVRTSIVMGLIEVESFFDTYACRYEPKWRWFVDPAYWARRVTVTDSTERMCQSMSWGLMQVMGAVYRELGGISDIPSMCDPHVGITFGIEKLNQLYRRYGNYESMLAAYNAGNPKSKAGLRYARKVFDASRKYKNRL